MKTKKALPFRVELIRQLKRRRTLIALILLIALPLIVVTAVKFGPSSDSNNGGGGYDNDQLVQEGQRVAIEHFPLKLSISTHRCKLGAAFAKTDEEGKQHHDHIQPGREPLDLDQADASGDTQCEECGN